MTADKDELQDIPGVGPAIAKALRAIGIHSQKDLSGQDPEDLFLRHEQHVGHPADRCLLYVFRCAVYYCNTPDPEQALLQWWNWKDKTR